jgi:LuxR family maltose regulon positive regulatory protein
LPKSAYRSTPVVVDSYLYTDDSYTGARVNAPAWFAWLSLGQTFYYKTAAGSFTARCEKRRNGRFWYAFHKRQGKLRKVYLGAATRLTGEMLERVATQLAS